jgi:NADH:ubiquinone oxidoreductase subunit 2 (subunit N)
MIIDNLIYYDNNILLFNDLYILNTFNIYFIILIYIIAMSLTTINIVNMSSINSISSVLKNYLNLNNFNRYYVTIILFNIIGIILFMTSNNIISIFIGIELQSYSLYILTGIPSKSNTSAHNSLFYYLIGGFGSIMILYGISLLYYTSGNIYLNNINILLDYTSFRSPLLMGYLFMIFGLLIKIGAGPMYN